MSARTTQRPDDTGDRELKGGRDFSLWPYLKWGHAARTADRLRHDFAIWRGSLGVESRAVYSDDRRVVTFYANITNQAPSYEWSLTFGDAVHNYRSALDALAWSMATLDGAQPTERDARRIYFPLKTTRAAFDKECQTALRTVPEFVQARMQHVQPYHVQPGQLIEEGIGLILHDLDIQDKHRATVEARPTAADRTSYGITYRPVDRSSWTGDDESSFPEWIADDGPLVDGQPIVRWSFPQPVQDVEIGNLPLRLAIAHGGSQHDAFELLRLIDLQVAETFAVVETGMFREQWGQGR